MELKLRLYNWPEAHSVTNTRAPLTHLSLEGGFHQSLKQIGLIVTASI